MPTEGVPADDPTCLVSLGHFLADNRPLSIVSPSECSAEAKPDADGMTNTTKDAGSTAIGAMTSSLSAPLEASLFP